MNTTNKVRNMAKNRVTLTDGRWYDADRAVVVCDERTHFDGRNRISAATGSQWDHERIVRTAGGTWVLLRWSQWQGSRTTRTPITAREAAAWILRVGDMHELPAELAEYASEGEA